MNGSYVNAHVLEKLSHSELAVDRFFRGFFPGEMSAVHCKGLKLLH